MRPVLTKDQSFFLDGFCIKNKIISKKELMDNAGKLSAQFFVEKIKNPFNQKVLVLAGKGDNGGDAVIMHHYLKIYGVKSKLYVFNKTKVNSFIKDYAISTGDILEKLNDSIIQKFNWFIDGIFGIGLNREIKPPYKKIIQKLKNRNIISLDIPSGIKCDSGLPFNDDIFCDPRYVISMGYLKNGNVVNLGKKYFKNTSIINIGFPDILDIDKTISNFTINSNDVKKILLEDDFRRNKYHSRATLIAGSDKYSGAAYLSTLSAVRMGAGYVKSIFPSKIHRVLCSIQDSIKMPIGNSQNSSFSVSDQKAINDLDIDNSILIGPGLGSAKKTMNFTIKMLERVKKRNHPCVLDASGFEPLYSGKIEIKDLPLKTILTPHLGEFKRIFYKYDLDFNNPIACCEGIASMLGGRVLILKGPSTIITSDQRILITNNSKSILATAGSGDVLSGMLLGLLSKGYDIIDASIIGVYIHGLISDIYYKKTSKHSMTAMDIINHIPVALNEAF